VFCRLLLLCGVYFLFGMLTTVVTAEPIDEEREERKFNAQLYPQYGSGWGMFNIENRSLQVRQAWLTLTDRPSYAFGASVHSRHHTTSEILFTWRDPSPSVSIKHVSDDEEAGLSESMELSCYLDGFRIVQKTNGELKAEFCVAFSYGSISYMSWKSYTDFAAYYQTIHLIHHQIKPLFPTTIREWETLQSRKKWFRCFSVRYLIEKSILIGRVVQSSLLESPTPGLLLEFLHHKKDQL
jgi:hypothetical protein